MLGGGPAIVLTVWESVGSALLRHPLPGATQFGREIGEISNEVVDDLDVSAAELARATAAEGVEIAEAGGFDARALSHRAIGAAGEGRQARSGRR